MKDNELSNTELIKLLLQRGAIVPGPFFDSLGVLLELDGRKRVIAMPSDIVNKLYVPPEENLLWASHTATMNFPSGSTAEVLCNATHYAYVGSRSLFSLDKKTKARLTNMQRRTV